MKLERVSQARNVITASAMSEAQARAGIRIEPVLRRYLPRDITVSGSAILNSPSMVPSPISGTVETLLLNGAGPDPVAVRKGQPLLTLRPAKGGPGDHQATEIKAVSNSWVTVSVRAGSTVQQGGALYFYTDLELIPVVANIPLALTSLIRPGTAAEMTCDCEPGTVWHGNVTDTIGSYNDLSRSVKVKLQFRNTSSSIQSNAPVHVVIHHRGSPVLSIPEDAVIWSGHRWICYVPKAGSASFAARTISVGMHTPGYFEVRSGLREGELVVSKAAFLVDAESHLKSEVIP